LATEKLREVHGITLGRESAALAPFDTTIFGVPAPPSDYPACRAGSTGLAGAAGGAALGAIGGNAGLGALVGGLTGAAAGGLTSRNQVYAGPSPFCF